jgi:hypothetical protein
MVLVKLGLPKEENIVSRNNFVVNKIFPIAIRSTTVPDQYIVLFVAHQDYNASYLYFQIMVKVENAFDQTYLEEHELNIKRYQNNQNSKSLEAYQKLISEITPNNLYATDFNMVQDPLHPMYFKSTCVRAIDNTHASIVDIYLPISNFVKIKVYLNRFTSLPIKKYIHEELFNDPIYNNIELVNIETVKMDCTKAEQVLENKELFTTHYTMNCGPSTYLMNWSIIETKELPLKVPLDLNLYDTFYKFHYNVKDVFLQDDNLYIVYKDSIICDKCTKAKVLRLNKELTDKTNFKDQLNIFIKGE